MAPGKLVTLLLSAGGNPESNHYSQYLQALRMHDFWKKIPGVDLTTMFGGGLTPASAPSASPDVPRAPDEYSPPTFIRGEIPNNKAATKANVSAYFRTTLNNRTWAPQDRFLLFVADHGNPNPYDPTDVRVNRDNEVRPARENNCITLWAPGVNLYPENACLSVSELKKLVQKNIPQSVPVNFVMTQCYSGAFHMLGYRRDENGFPHREGNVCGFTAITRDTTASGCTSFVEEDNYDGYERRIAEAMTGSSVITGGTIGKSQASLSAAHDSALMLDNTKDVPLRSSEGYVLDYFSAAKEKMGSADRSKKGADVVFDNNANAMWLRLKTGVVIKELNPVLQDDMKRRLTLVGQLVKQVAKWQPTHSAQITGANLNQIMALRRAVSSVADSLSEKLADTRKTLSAKRKYIKAKYFLSLKNASDAQSMTFLEFASLDNVERDIIYARLQQEDPTLKKFERYLRFESEFWDTILTWAEQHPAECSTIDVSDIKKLITQVKTMGAEVGRLEVLEGELQRIESQMTVAVAIAMAAEGNDTNSIADITSLVECERAARSAL